MIKMGVLSVRLDPEMETQIEYLMKHRKIIDKSAYIRTLLDKSIRQDLIDVLSIAVKNKELSVWKAAELAHITLRQMLQELANRDIPTYDEQAFQQDLEFLRSV